MLQDHSSSNTPSLGVGRTGRPDNTRQHNYMTRTDMELILPDSHAKCVGAGPLYDAKRGISNPVNSICQQQQQQQQQ